MLYHNKPHNYTSDMEVSEGIIECGGKVLLVQRSEHCSAWGTWCGPGGKLDPWETCEEALMREIHEETGIDISEFTSEKLFTKYFYFLGKNIKIHFYKIFFESEPEVILNSEHQDSIWVYPQEALEMNLNEDFDEILKEIYSL